jgi:hypothetical protein
MLCGYPTVVYIFICCVRFAEALRQVVKAGSKIVEVVWAPNIVAQPRRGRGHHSFPPTIKLARYKKWRDKLGYLKMICIRENT